MIERHDKVRDVPTIQFCLTIVVCFTINYPHRQIKIQDEKNPLTLR